MSGPGDYIGQGPGQRVDWSALIASGPQRRLTFMERWRAAEAEARDRRGVALRQVAAVRVDAARALAHGRMPDSELRALAERRAELLGQLIDGLQHATTPAALLAWLCGQVEPLQGRPFEFEGDAPEGEQLRGFMARARCPLWWRRQLRRAAVTDREDKAQAAGEVCAARRQPYVTNDTLHRHQLRKASNAAMMAATQLENDAGQVMTLAELAATTTGNKAIRRGELMTRISGCEKLAEAMGLRGMFTTQTAPSRFHRALRHGGLNPRWEPGCTPKAAQAWLCGAWARARAKLHRLGIAVFGFRVAEPHHDGTPHWHCLLWTKPDEWDRAAEVLRAAWLKFDGDEPGAAEHRFKAKLLDRGGAAGYIAKYIAKNIDDAGSVGHEGHQDDGGGQGADSRVGGMGGADDALPAAQQGDLFGGTAKRVEAWAGAHGIRQFQAIGQPPVTVWRELRRIPAQAQGGATPRLAVAFEAVNREGLRKADWAAYVLAQGGLWRGREYLIRIAAVIEARAGRYGTTDQARPVAVFDSTGPGDWHLSERREWRPRGEWRGNERAPVRGPFAAPPRPWTRVNNCTGAHGRDLMQLGIVGATRQAKRPRVEPGAGRNHESTSNGQDRSPERHPAGRSPGPAHPPRDRGRLARPA